MSMGTGLAKMLAASSKEERRAGAREFTAAQETLRRDVEAAGGKIVFGQTGEQMSRSLSSCKRRTQELNQDREGEQSCK